MAFDLNLKLKCHGTHDYDPLTYFRHIKSLLHSQFTFPFCGESSSLWWPANILILTRWKTTPFACNSHGKSNQTNWSGINRWKLKLIPKVSYLLKELRCAALLEIEITLKKEKKNQYLPFEWLSVVSSYRIENGSLKREKGKNLVRTHAMRESISFLPGLKITVSQQTMSGLIGELTGQPLVLPVMLTSHIWSYWNWNKLKLPCCSVVSVVISM